MRWRKIAINWQIQRRVGGRFRANPMPEDSIFAPAMKISIVITCYNHARYLGAAIESVQRQTRKADEVLVVDDGSTDDTRTVTETYAGVRYLYQKNAGLAAARNSGTVATTGDALVFLDADDWLLPTALAENAQRLEADPALAFVSGGHRKQYEDGTEQTPEPVEVHDAYQQLLRWNYIEMHGAVMYRRWAVAAELFDATLPTCEDYDLYLRLAQKHPVAHHNHPLAVYRFHEANMSGNAARMLQGAMQTLDKQEPAVRTREEKEALAAGRQKFKDYYGSRLLQALSADLYAGRPLAQPALATLRRWMPEAHRRFHTQRRKHNMRTLIKRLLPGFAPAMWQAYRLHRKGLRHFGDLHRTTTFSNQFGYDRGGPVDRYYIEGFLKAEAGRVKGRVLEIGDNEYTLRFGGDKVAKSDVLHVHAGNPQATFVGDLTDAPQVPDNAFDCIVLTQTLHLIYDFRAALRTCHRVLKPGGALLLTVPGISPIDRHEWGETWYWSFTQAAVKRLLAETFPGGEATVESRGNAFTAAAFLYGLGLPETDPQQLDAVDPHVPVIITAVATKNGTA